LPDVLVRQLTRFEVEQHETLEQIVVKKPGQYKNLWTLN
jgi:hypothetical protein